MDEIKRELSEEIRNLESALREEVEQRQRLEGMLDDQQQLHQAKMEDLKSQVEMQEEQAVYQIRDNSKTMGESLKMLEMRVLKLEEKRLEEYPQFGEGFSPGGDSRALLMKLLTGIVTNALLIFNPFFASPGRPCPCFSKALPGHSVKFAFVFLTLHAL